MQNPITPCEPFEVTFGIHSLIPKIVTPGTSNEYSPQYLLSSLIPALKLEDHFTTKYIALPLRSWGIVPHPLIALNLLCLGAPDAGFCQLIVIASGLNPDLESSGSARRSLSSYSHRNHLQNGSHRGLFNTYKIIKGIGWLMLPGVQVIANDRLGRKG